MTIVMMTPITNAVVTRPESELEPDGPSPRVGFLLEIDCREHAGVEPQLHLGVCVEVRVDVHGMSQRCAEASAGRQACQG